MFISFKIEPLNVVCSEIIDCVNKTAPVVEYETPFKMIRTTNVKKGRVNLSSVRYVTEETFIKWTRRAKPKRNDIILTREAPLGEVGLLRSDDNIFLGQRLIQYRANPSIIDQLFLYYAFQDDFMQGQIRSYGSGATVEHLRIGDCETIKVKFPPLPIQQKIASILSSYDELIENNNQRIKLLEEIAEEIYKEWFVRFRFPGYENTKFIDGLPEGWEKKSIGECFNVTLGGTPSREIESYWNGSIPWINSGKVNDLRIIEASEYITELGLKKSATKLLPKKTTLLAITGATLGQISFLEIESCVNQSVVGIKDPNNKIDEFVFLTMKEKIKDLVNYAGGGAQQHINKAVVENGKIVLPDIKTLEQFISIVKPQFDLLATLMFKNQVLQETRDLLLPRLISGKLSVEHLVVNYPDFL